MMRARIVLQSGLTFLKKILQEEILPWFIPFIYLCLLFCLLISLIRSLEVTWPLWLLLLTSAIGWRLAKKLKNAFGKASEEILLSTTIGLSILCVVSSLLNLSGQYISPATLHSSEEALIKFYLNLKTATDKLTLLVTLIVIVILILLARHRPDWHPVTRFLKVKKMLARTQVVLITITSFSLFSIYPLKELADKDHQQMVFRYEMLLRQEKGKIADYIAAEQLKTAVAQLSDTNKQGFRMLFEEIDAQSKKIIRQTRRSTVVLEAGDFIELEAGDLPAPKLAEAIAEGMAVQHSKKVEKSEALLPEPSGGKLSDPNELAIKTSPTSVQQRERQQILIDQQAIRSWETEQVAKEAMEGLKETFAKTLLLGTPKLEGIAGKFFEKLVSETGKQVFSRAVSNWWNQRAIDRVRTGVSRPITEARGVLSAAINANQLLVPSEWKTSVIAETTKATEALRMTIVREVEAQRAEVENTLRQEKAARFRRSIERNGIREGERARERSNMREREVNRGVRGR